MITRSIARKVTLTSAPCNQQCVAELMPEKQESAVKDDFEFLFKSEANAIELFKSEEGVKIYEQFLAKKEESLSPLQKSEKLGWSQPKVAGDTVHYSHPEHGVVSIQKQPSGQFHVKHEGKLAGIGGVKGSFGTASEAGTHAKNYMRGISNHSVVKPSVHNRPSPSMLNKALEAGSYNAAPSALTSGAAYQVEHIAGSKKKKLQKTDWHARAKQDYENWPKREEFEKFMAARMPHLAPGEVKAIGRTIALKKSIDFEKSLLDLVKKEK